MGMNWEDFLSTDRDGIGKAVTMLNYMEGLNCAYCGRSGGNIHHFLERTKTLKGSKAREAAECHELLIRLCPSCHRAIHGSRDMRIWAMRYKRGRYDMDAALERVNAHLKRDITWASLGFT